MADNHSSDSDNDDQEYNDDDDEEYYDEDLAYNDPDNPGPFYSEDCSLCHTIKTGPIKNDLECGHKFHITCMDQQFIDSNTCPICSMRERALTASQESVPEVDQGPPICIICGEVLTEDSISLHCTHIFHSDCIQDWRENKKDCPVCRQPVQYDPTHHLPFFKDWAYKKLHSDQSQQEPGNLNMSSLQNIESSDTGLSPQSTSEHGVFCHTGSNKRFECDTDTTHLNVDCREVSPPRTSTMWTQLIYNPDIYSAAQVQLDLIGETSPLNSPSLSNVSFEGYHSPATGSSPQPIYDPTLEWGAQNEPGNLSESEAQQVQNCGICLTELTEDHRELNCMDRFHHDCIDDWFTQTNTCPVCGQIEPGQVDPFEWEPQNEEED